LKLPQLPELLRSLVTLREPTEKNSFILDSSTDCLVTVRSFVMSDASGSVISSFFRMMDLQGPDNFRVNETVGCLTTCLTSDGSFWRCVDGFSWVFSGAVRVNGGGLHRY